MRIDPQIAASHWEQAAIEQVTRDLESKGFEVSLHEQIAGVEADLIARRDGRVIVYEFKVGRWNPERVQQAAELRRHAIEDLGASFRLILVNTPHEPEVEVEGLESELASLLRHNLPPALDELSSSTAIEDVYDVRIDSLNINREITRVSGEAIAAVRLRWGRGDDLAEEATSFPFEFELMLNSVDHTSQLLSVEVDVGDWYGTNGENEDTEGDGGDIGDQTRDF